MSKNGFDPSLRLRSGQAVCSGQAKLTTRDENFIAFCEEIDTAKSNRNVV